MIKLKGYAVHRALGVAIVLTTSACKPPAQKFADQLETSASWLAAIDMAARSWQENRVPVRFAHRVIDEARAGLITSARAIADLDVQDADVDVAGAELARAVAAVDTMLAAVDRRDRAGVGQATVVIAARREVIDSLAKRANSIPK